VGQLVVSFDADFVMLMTQSSKCKHKRDIVAPNAFKKVLVLIDKYDKESPKYVEKLMKPVWEVVGIPVLVKEVPLSEFSVTNALSEVPMANVSNILVCHADFSAEVMIILVRKGYASAPTHLEVEADPVTAALTIARCKFFV
jgi:hypothetical protein